jgi:hypothetical protein
MSSQRFPGPLTSRLFNRTLGRVLGIGRLFFDVLNSTSKAAGDINDELHWSKFQPDHPAAMPTGLKARATAMSPTDVERYGRDALAPARKRAIESSGAPITASTVSLYSAALVAVEQELGGRPFNAATVALSFRSALVRLHDPERREAIAAHLEDISRESGPRWFWKLLDTYQQARAEVPFSTGDRRTSEHLEQAQANVAAEFFSEDSPLHAFLIEQLKTYESDHLPDRFVEALTSNPGMAAYEINETTALRVLLAYEHQRSLTIEAGTPAYQGLRGFFNALATGEDSTGEISLGKGRRRILLWVADGWLRVREMRHDVKLSSGHEMRTLLCAPLIGSTKACPWSNESEIVDEINRQREAPATGYVFRWKDPSEPRAKPAPVEQGEVKGRGKYVEDPWRYLVDTGLLGHINRMALHPVGLALSVQTENDDGTGKAIFGGLVDGRDDPEGICFYDTDLADVYARLSASGCTLRMSMRAAALGYLIQPSPLSPDTATMSEEVTLEKAIENAAQRAAALVVASPHSAVEQFKIESWLKSLKVRLTVDRMAAMDPKVLRFGKYVVAGKAATGERFAGIAHDQEMVDAGITTSFVKRDKECDTKEKAQAEAERLRDDFKRVFNAALELGDRSWRVGSYDKGLPIPQRWVRQVFGVEADADKWLNKLIGIDLAAGGDESVATIMAEDARGKKQILATIPLGSLAGIPLAMSKVPEELPGIGGTFDVEAIGVDDETAAKLCALAEQESSATLAIPGQAPMDVRVISWARDHLPDVRNVHRMTFTFLRLTAMVSFGDTTLQALFVPNPDVIGAPISGTIFDIEVAASEASAAQLESLMTKRAIDCLRLPWHDPMRVRVISWRPFTEKLGERTRGLVTFLIEADGVLRGELSAATFTVVSMPRWLPKVGDEFAIDIAKVEGGSNLDVELPALSGLSDVPLRIEGWDEIRVAIRGVQPSLRHAFPELTQIKPDYKLYLVRKADPKKPSGKGSESGAVPTPSTLADATADPIVRSVGGLFGDVALSILRMPAKFPRVGHSFDLVIEAVNIRELLILAERGAVAELTVPGHETSIARLVSWGTAGVMPRDKSQMVLTFQRVGAYGTFGRSKDLPERFIVTSSPDKIGGVGESIYIEAIDLFQDAIGALAAQVHGPPATLWLPGCGPVTATLTGLVRNGVKPVSALGDDGVVGPRFSALLTFQREACPREGSFNRTDTSAAARFAVLSGPTELPDVGVPFTLEVMPIGDVDELDRVFTILAMYGRHELQIDNNDACGTGWSARDVGVLSIGVSVPEVVPAFRQIGCMLLPRARKDSSNASGGEEPKVDAHDAASPSDARPGDDAAATTRVLRCGVGLTGGGSDPREAPPLVPTEAGAILGTKLLELMSVTQFANLFSTLYGAGHQTLPLEDEEALRALFASYVGRFNPEIERTVKAGISTAIDMAIDAVLPMRNEWGMPELTDAHRDRLRAALRAYDARGKALATEAFLAAAQSLLNNPHSIDAINTLDSIGMLRSSSAPGGGLEAAPWALMMCLHFERLKMHALVERYGYLMNQEAQNGTMGATIATLSIGGRCFRFLYVETTAMEWSEMRFVSVNSTLPRDGRATVHHCVTNEVGRFSATDQQWLIGQAREGTVGLLSFGASHSDRVVPAYVQSFFNQGPVTIGFVMVDAATRHPNADEPVESIDDLRRRVANNLLGMSSLYFELENAVAALREHDRRPYESPMLAARLGARILFCGEVPESPGSPTHEMCLIMAALLLSYEQERMDRRSEAIARGRIAHMDRSHRDEIEADEDARRHVDEKLTIDGKIDRQAVINEIRDYYLLGSFVPLVYSGVTGGRVSKPFTRPEAVLAVAEEVRNQQLAWDLSEAPRERSEEDELLDVNEIPSLVADLFDGKGGLPSWCDRTRHELTARGIEIKAPRKRDIAGMNAAELQAEIVERALSGLKLVVDDLATDARGVQFSIEDVRGALHVLAGAYPVSPRLAPAADTYDIARMYDILRAALPAGVLAEDAGAGHSFWGLELVYAYAVACAEVAEQWMLKHDWTPPPVPAPVEEPASPAASTLAQTVVLEGEVLAELVRESLAPEGASPPVSMSPEAHRQLVDALAAEAPAGVLAKAASLTDALRSDEAAQGAPPGWGWGWPPLTEIGFTVGEPKPKALSALSPEMDSGIAGKDAAKSLLLDGVEIKLTGFFELGSDAGGKWSAPIAPPAPFEIRDGAAEVAAGMLELPSGTPFALKVGGETVFASGMSTKPAEPAPATDDDGAGYQERKPDTDEEGNDDER